MDGLWISALIVLWALVLAIGFLLLGALRQIGLVQLRLGDDPGALITNGGLDRGVAAPDFEAIDSLSGEKVRLSDLTRAARLMVFLSPSCLACRLLVPHLNEVKKTRHHEFDFVTICRGDLGDCRAFRNLHNLAGTMLIDLDGSTERTYQIPATPFAYFLDSAGRVLIRGITNDWTHLESLLNQEGTPEKDRRWIELTQTS